MAEEDDWGAEAKLGGLKLEDANDPESKARKEKVKALQAEASKNPKDAAVWAQLANALFAADQIDEASPAFDKVGLGEVETPACVHAQN